MLRAILQENKEVMTALICSLLHLKRSKVTSVVITNPIQLGEHIDDKDFILDIVVLLNHITLFPEHPEFYATYKLLNIKNHHLYSDKFTLSVVNLTQIDMATEEDKNWGVDYWAKLFKAKTWEELRMMSKKNDALHEASEALYVMNADQMIREQCRAREDYYRIQNTMKHKMEVLTSEKEELMSEKKALTSQNEALTSENEALKNLLSKHGISYYNCYTIA